MLAIDRVLETVLYAERSRRGGAVLRRRAGPALDSRKAGLFCFFRVGQGMLLLFDPRRRAPTATSRRMVPSAPGHACFAVAESELDGWQARLRHGA